MAKCSADELNKVLQQCTGSEGLTPIQFTNIFVTDGIVTMAKKAEANWLVTDIAIACSGNVGIKDLKNLDFTLITFEVKEDKTASWIVQEDSDQPVLYYHKYDYTDFPVGTWKIYIRDHVMMLPSEY